MDEYIFQAARSGEYKVLIDLIDQCDDLPLLCIDYAGNNLLHLVLFSYSSAYREHRGELLQCVVKLVEAGFDVNHFNDDQQTPVYIAASRGLYNVLLYFLDLIDQCVDIPLEVIDDEGNTLLHFVLFSYSSAYLENRGELLQCVVKLVEAGLDVNHFNDHQQTPVFLAASQALYNVLLYFLDLVDQCVDIPLEVVDDEGNTLLHFVLFSYSSAYLENRGELLQCVVKLVEAGLDVNHFNEHQQTPVYIAARQALYKVVIYLIDQGVGLPLQYIDDEGNNLLHLVSFSYTSDYRENRDELLQCVIKLVEAGLDVNHFNGYHQTPVYRAAMKALYKVVIYLLEHGAEVHYIDEYEYTVLHRILYGYVMYDIGNETGELLHCITKLVEAGVDINHPNEDGQTPIFIATRTGSYKVVQYFLEHGSYVHGSDKEKCNLLHRVLLQFFNFLCDSDPDAFSNCISKLVEAGVDVNHLNKDKQTPIVIAASNCQYDIVKYLLDNGADVKYVDVEDRNILHILLSNIDVDLNGDSGERFIDGFSDQCFEAVETLIKMKVDVNKPDKHGNTPLFYIVRQITESNLFSLQKYSILFKLYYNLITALVKAGCNVNHQNKEGQTALMYYTRNQADIRILKLMIQHSDVNLTDNNGDTVCIYCVQYHAFNCTNIFKLYSRDVLLSPNNGLKLYHQILACKRLGLFNYYIGLKLIVNGVTTEGENMLHLLARVNYDYSLKKFNWLFNKELDINHPCFKTNTPIMVAALLLNSKYLEVFTRHPRIDINAQNNQGHTALHLCIIGFTIVKDGLHKRLGYPFVGLNERLNNDVIENYCRRIYPIYMECVDILLAAVSIDVNIADGEGKTALMMAAMKNDRFLIRKLLNAGAMVNYNGRSALHLLDIYESVFDQSFKLLASAADNRLLNSPCINGNTLIQAALRFPRFWDPRTAVSFIKYLVGENCCLQSLVTPLVESSYTEIEMRELSSNERDKLRKLLYLSGAPEKEIVATLNFETEDSNVEGDEMKRQRLLYLRGASDKKIYFQDEDKGGAEDGIHSRHQAIFTNYCCNISLMSQCRRIIRQKLGLGIKEKVMDLELPRELNDFLLLKYVLHPKDYNIDNIDDDCNDFDDDDGYSGYDINIHKEDHYSQYNYQSFTLLTDVQIRQEMGLKEGVVNPNLSSFKTGGLFNTLGGYRV